jgi:tetratricopeptide (TPR) repeat protein
MRIMTNKVIEAKANSLFAQNNYSEAFDALLTLGAEAFVNAFPRTASRAKTFLEKHLSQERVKNFFWKEYIIADIPFHTLFGSTAYAELFHLFFLSRIESPAILQKLASAYPQKLIRSVRVHAAFLDDFYWQSLGRISFNDELSNKHKELWQIIRNAEALQWKEVVEKWQLVKDHEIEKLLIELTMWCEARQWSNGQADVVNLHYLGSAYSLIISYITSQFGSIELLAEEKLSAFYTGVIREKQLDTEFSKFADAVLSWVIYKQNFIDFYCHNQNSELISECGEYAIKEDPKRYYKWKLNGMRYSLNQLFYFLDSSALVDELVATGDMRIPVGREPGDYDVNFKLACDKYASVLFLEDLCIHEFKTSSGNIDIHKVATNLIALSTNKFVRNEKAKFEIGAGSIFDVWSQIKFAEDITGLIRRPYVHETTGSFPSLMVRAHPETNMADAAQILELITGKQKGKKGFNRFNIEHDVFLKPFYQIGASFFVPAIFMGHNSWFYSLAQEALLNNDRGKTRNEALALESYLGVCFERHFKQVIVVDTAMKEKLQAIGAGDVDIIIYHEHTLILIQLKRTYFRTTLKDALAEQQLIDRKAQKQLNGIREIATNKEAEFFDITGLVKKAEEPLKIVEWYISNSFEGTGARNAKCIKLNYFDVLRALRYHSAWPSIEEFISFVEKDKLYFKIAYDTPIDAKILFQIPLPMFPFERKEYVIPIEGKGNNEVWNAATNAYHSNEKGRAMDLFREYLEEYPESSEGWGALANTYVDVGDVGQAENCFSKALSLDANDPFIKRNYAYFLLELKRIPEALGQLIELYELYHLFDSLHFDIPNIFQYCEEQQITTVEIVGLKDRWSSLQ